MPRSPDPSARRSAIKQEGGSHEYRQEFRRRRPIEKALDKKTGKASGDTEKSPERKFEEMGERDEIRDKAGREREGR